MFDGMNIMSRLQRPSAGKTFIGAIRLIEFNMPDLVLGVESRLRQEVIRMF
jgi:hypothetical protein